MLNLDKLSLEEMLGYQRIGIAFSGGVDSHVLLHFLTKKLHKHTNLFALHINHGINDQSNLWERHCKEICNSLGVNFVSFKLSFKDSSSVNEHDLRKARYSKLLSWANDEDVICTAHNKDDNTETILFRIIRGTGIKGLKGIPFKRKIGNVHLIRPFLQISKSEIIDYAKKNNLFWIEDPSNQDITFSRNFLRADILPLIKKRWPKYTDSFSHLSIHAKYSQEIAEEVADLDLKKYLLGSSNQLSLSCIGHLSEARFLNLLHRWLSNYSNQPISFKIIQEIKKTFLSENKQTDPIITLGGVDNEGSFQLRKYGEVLFILPHISPVILNERPSLQWNMENPIDLPTGKLTAIKSFGKGLETDAIKGNINIQWRIGGERCKPAGRNKSQRLKKLLQEYEIPPWLRDRLPLIYIDEKLAAVADVWVCDKFLASKEKLGVCFDWKDNLNDVSIFRRKSNGF